MDLRSLLANSPARPTTALVAAAQTFVASPAIAQWTPTDTQRLTELACDPSASASDRHTLLQALKLVAKEPHLNSCLYASQHFAPLARSAGLSPSGSDDDAVPSASENDPVVNEARKIIANLLLLNRNAALTIFSFEQCIPPLVAVSKSQDLSLESTFLVFRILFLLTASPDHIQSVVAAGTDYYQLHVARLLQAPTDGHPPFTRAACLAELLKTMFNLQSFTSSDHNSPSPIFGLAAMQTVARVISELPIASTSSPMSPPLSHAVHVLMCGPPEGWCTPFLARVLCSQVLEPELAAYVFPATEDPKAGPFTSKMMAAASSSTMTNDLHASAGDRLSPLLHLLAHVYMAEAKRADGGGSADSKHVCEALKALLVPQDMDRKVSIDHGRGLGHFMIRLLTYVESSALREATEVLMFALCDSNASTMVAHTGLGPSAGFLVNRGLLTEDILKAAGHDPKVNPITGQKEDDQADFKAEWEKMTDEEKEAEAEKLFVQFERLNKLGIIKAVDPTTGREIGR